MSKSNRPSALPVCRFCGKTTCLTGRPCTQHQQMVNNRHGTLQREHLDTLLHYCLDNTIFTRQELSEIMKCDLDKIPYPKDSMPSILGDQR